MPRRFFFFSALMLICSSCAKSTIIDPYFFQNGMEEINIKAVVDPAFPKSKTFRVIDAHLDANLLYLQIEYKEPCSGAASFEFFGGTLYYDEQNRARRDARLVIGSNYEECDLVKQTKIVDVRDLTSLPQRDAEVILNIGGWRTQMTYIYVPHKKN